MNKTVAILGSGGRDALLADLIRQYAYLGKATTVAETRASRGRCW
jgi:hypothetical protein